MYFEHRIRKPLSIDTLIKTAYPFDRERWTDQFSRMKDRAAYMFVTGAYPSHLRAKATGILRQISHDFCRPVSLDGRLMGRKLRKDAVADLGLEEHAMVKTIRKKVSEGYKIEICRGPNSRRGFSKVFMFKRLPDQMAYHMITVSIDGAIKDGWA